MFVKKDVYNQKGCLSQQVRKNTYIAGHSSGMRIYLSSSVIIKPCEADINVKLKEQSMCMGMCMFMCFRFSSGILVTAVGLFQKILLNTVAYMY